MANNPARRSRRFIPHFLAEHNSKDLRTDAIIRDILQLKRAETPTREVWRQAPALVSKEKPISEDH
jgi:hypothetical protein